MKKIIALLLAVLMTVSMLAACSSAPAETTAPPAEGDTQPQVKATDPPAEKEKVTLKVWADQGELLLDGVFNHMSCYHPMFQDVMQKPPRYTSRKSSCSGKQMR